MIFRVAMSRDDQSEWTEVMAIEVADSAELAPALHRLADEFGEAIAFERIVSRSGLSDEH